MIDIKVGDTLRVVQEFTAKVKSDTLDVRVKFLEGQSFRVDAAQGHVFTTNMDVRMPLGVVRAAVTMGPGLIIDGKLERLHPIEEGPEPPDPEPPEPEEPPTATYRLTYVALKKGRNRPGTNMLQMAATKLGELKNRERCQVHPGVLRAHRGRRSGHEDLARHDAGPGQLACSAVPAHR
jgi:hypothetical protein